MDKKWIPALASILGVDLLTGQAAPATKAQAAAAVPADARVRLATPEGETRFATANDKGVWTLVLPGAAQPRIFGLSATAGARPITKEDIVKIYRLCQ